MSANNIKTYTAQGYHFYSVESEGKTFIIGGVPERYAADYIKITASADAVILLTSKPEFTGGLERVLELKPELEVYATPAGLRNIKEIVNREINEKLIKDGTELCGIQMLITPNLSWVDSCMALYDGVLFSGECFSGFYGSAVELKKEFDTRLRINSGFVESAIRRLEKARVNAIYPAYGQTMPQGTVCMCAEPQEVFDKFRSWCRAEESEPRRAAIIYASEYGYTKSLAEYLAKKLENQFSVSISDVAQTATAQVIKELNTADVVLVGTNTVNRNAPRKIWAAVTGMDLVNKRGTPYFVFGSFGWAGDAIKLIEKTLAAMGLREAVKPVEVLFKPSADDFERMDKAVERIVAYVNKNGKRG